MYAGLVTMALAAVGFLSPAARGALLTTAIVLYLLLAVAAGYGAVYTWGLTQRSYTGWTAICLKTACYFPGAYPAVCAALACDRASVLECIWCEGHLCRMATRIAAWS